jgi:6-phosphogluconolactonase (cycloisomerase 2 family)/PKD repeat protein
MRRRTVHRTRAAAVARALTSLVALLLAAGGSASAATPGRLTPLPGPGACIEGTLAPTWIFCPAHARGIHDVHSVAVSPDGRFAYTASVEADSIGTFARNPSTGVLTPLSAHADCLEDTRAPSSTDCPVDAAGLDGALTVALSPDGKHAYVASINAQAIAAFARNSATGELTPLPGDGACIEDSSERAEEPPGRCPREGEGLHGLRYVAVSPDGRNVYTTAPAGDAIAAFARNPVTGKLTQLSGDASCVEDVLAARGTHCPSTAVGLNYPRSLSVSPDGRHVYVASDVADRRWTGDAAAGNAVSAFERDPDTGALTQLPGDGACIEDERAPATTSCPVRGRGLDGPFGISLSPDGRHAYVGGHNGDTVALFERNATTGVLRQLSGADGCIKDANVGGTACTRTALGLNGALGVTVSPDGTSAYVASFHGHSVAAFSRNPVTGLLTQLPGDDACFEDVRAPKATKCPVPVHGLRGVRDVVLSPGGEHAYAPASSGRTIAGLGRLRSAAALIATTGAAVDVTESEATLTGSLNTGGAPATWRFEYGLTSAYGSSTTARPADSSGPEPVSAAVTGLRPGSTYHYRLVANGPGSAAGQDRTFTATAPSVSAKASADPTAGPAPLTVRFRGSDSTSSGGEQLTFDWDFGDGTPHSSASNPTHTYGQGGRDFTARLTVRDPSGASDSTTLTVSPSAGAPPDVSIDAPAEYRNGVPFTVTGSARDADGRPLPASALEWETKLVHGDHEHDRKTSRGTASVTLTAPTDHDANSFYSVHLTATDSDGAAATETVEVTPETRQLTIESDPPGAGITYAGANLTAPVVKESAVGFVAQVAALDSFTANGSRWVFDSWSDGGARVHDVTMPASNLNLVASYRRAGPAAAATIEAETMTSSMQKYSPTKESDPLASGGRRLGMWWRGTAGTRQTLPAVDRIVVHAKGTQCQGAPTLNVAVDGVQVMSVPVVDTAYADYGTTLLSTLPPGSHEITVSFPNDFARGRCDRNLFVDKLTLE